MDIKERIPKILGSMANQSNAKIVADYIRNIEAERDKYREALNRINNCGGLPGAQGNELVEHIIRIAQSALKGEPEE